MNYQLTYIVPSDMANFTELEKIITGINGQIQEMGGTIKEPIPRANENQMHETFKADEEIKRISEAQKASIFKHRLSYPIKRHYYGYYISTVFGAEGKKSAAAFKKLNSNLNLDKGILRFIITTIDLETIAKQKEQRKKLRTKKESEPVSGKKTEKAPADDESILISEETGKSKIEELDKKLEQILNT